MSAELERHVLSPPHKGAEGYCIECSCGYKTRYYWLPYQCHRPAQSHQKQKLKRIEEAIRDGR